MAHDLVPHIHKDAQHTVSSHHHSDHNLADGHAHIVHGSHLDKGILDFVVCLLVELKHPNSQNSDKISLPSQDDMLIKKWSKKASSAYFSQLKKEFPFSNTISSRFVFNHLSTFYASQYLTAYSDRGPPFLV